MPFAMTEDKQARFISALIQAATAIEVPLTDDQLESCLRYTEFLLSVNETMNLTRITEMESVAVKHFADSLTVLRAVPHLPDGATVIDVGTGAGFPGIVLKIVRPDLRLVLLDSVGKRLGFLQEVAEGLEMQNVSTVHARAEDAGRDRQHRDHYDLVVARAVAMLPVLLEWCGPLVKPAGNFVAMKGANAREEFVTSHNATNQLSLRFLTKHEFTLPPVPDDPEPAQRHLLLYRKLGPTPGRFPRRPAEIKANPL